MELESFKSHLLASRVGSQIRARNSFMQAQNKPVFFEDGKHLGKPGHSLGNVSAFLKLHTLVVAMVTLNITACHDHTPLFNSSAL